MLKHVVDSIMPIVSDVTVFDNASIVPETLSLLSRFSSVFRADRNVGYWSAIDWWLESLAQDPPDYTYIIESDMVHYDIQKLSLCESYLSTHPDVGAIRLHTYSIANRHLYDKDRPQKDSKRNLWQSHTNKASGEPVTFEQAQEPEFQLIWKTNFLTQLPALNRYTAMRTVFQTLRTMKTFSELDFQKKLPCDTQDSGHP